MSAILVEKCRVMAFLRLMMSFSFAVFPSSGGSFLLALQALVFSSTYANLVMMMCYVFRPGFGLF